jgi:hypothetical protein
MFSTTQIAIFSWGEIGIVCSVSLFITNALAKKNLTVIFSFYYLFLTIPSQKKILHF